MSIIGRKAQSGGNITILSTDAQNIIHGNAEYDYRAGDGEEVFLFGVYRRSGGNATDTLDMALYELKAGDDVGSTLVGSGTIRPARTAAGFYTTILKTPIPLRPGGTYVLGFKTSNQFFALRNFAGGTSVAFENDAVGTDPFERIWGGVWRIYSQSQCLG